MRVVHAQTADSAAQHESWGLTSIVSRRRRSCSGRQTQTRTSAAGSAIPLASQQQRLQVRSASTSRQAAPHQAALHSPQKSGSSASLTRGNGHQLGDLVG